VDKRNAVRRRPEFAISKAALCGHLEGYYLGHFTHRLEDTRTFEVIRKLGTLAIYATVAFVPFIRAEKSEAEHIPVRVVVVTTFEIGNDEGDTPGEFQNWVAKLPLPIVLPFRQGYHHLRYNAEKQVLGVVAGEGPSRMASSITALANDRRFDFSHTYWILAGIAGVDPNVSTAASAAWARHVVDGDLAYEIDPREIPSGWTTGYVPFGRRMPYQPPRPPLSSASGTNEFTLNAGLVDWAYHQSSAHIRLPDDSTLQNLRSKYVGFPKAQKAPMIVEGDVLAAGTFWIGGLLNTWAEDWVDYWTSGKGVFTMSSEEDAAYMQALTFLSQASTVDLQRVMVLRSGSNFTVQPPGQTASQQLAGEADATGLSGFTESLNSTYETGSSVVDELSRNWELYRDHIPDMKP
jgi:purine nucleoside permease